MERSWNNPRWGWTSFYSCRSSIQRDLIKCLKDLVNLLWAILNPCLLDVDSKLILNLKPKKKTKDPVDVSPAQTSQRSWNNPPPLWKVYWNLNLKFGKILPIHSEWILNSMQKSHSFLVSDPESLPTRYLANLESEFNQKKDPANISPIQAS